jgi:hypothetical protein
MKNFNDLVPFNKIDLDLGEINKYQLEYFIYKKLFDDVMSKYIYINENSKEYYILDVFCTKTHVKNCIHEMHNVKYIGLDIISEYNRNGEIIKPDIVCDINKIPLKDNSYDFIFCRADRLGYGKNHQSLFEIERVIRKNGYMVVSLSKFWYNVGFNQMLFCYRSWKYLEAIEIKYNFEDQKNGNKEIIATSKFFLIYKYYGD